MLTDLNAGAHHPHHNGGAMYQPHHPHHVPAVPPGAGGQGGEHPHNSMAASVISPEGQAYTSSDQPLNGNSSVVSSLSTISSFEPYGKISTQITLNDVWRKIQIVINVSRYKLNHGMLSRNGVLI